MATATRNVFGDLSNAENVPPTKAPFGEEAVRLQKKRRSSSDDGGFYSQEGTPTVETVS